MGKQLGIINVRGKTGDMGYVKTEDGYFVRRNTSMTKDRIKNDESFIRTRLNNSEFGLATKAGRLVRGAVTNQLKNAGDSKLASRLVKLMMQVRTTDETSDLGFRAAHKGELGLLDNFEFNRHTLLNAVFSLPFETVVDRVAGTVTLEVPGFTPAHAVSAPNGVTHFMLVTSAAELDFENEKHETSEEDSDFIPVSGDPVAAFSIVHNITAGSVLPLMAVIGIRFYTKVNGKYYKNNTNEYNAMRIVKIDTP